MASKERNEEKNVKNYNYEWQTDEEIVANAHTKEFLRQGRIGIAALTGYGDAIGETFLRQKRNRFIPLTFQETIRIRRCFVRRNFYPLQRNRIRSVFLLLRVSPKRYWNGKRYLLFFLLSNRFSAFLGAEAGQDRVQAACR